MNTGSKQAYAGIRSGRAGFYEHARGLIAVHGKEAVQFLDGLITNDMKTLAEGDEMLAAFPNAQGRLLAVARIRRREDKYFIETEAATREALFANLFKFTYAGDFFVEDLSDQFRPFEIFGPRGDIYHPTVGERIPGAFVYELPHGALYYIPADHADGFREFLASENSCVVIDDELYETLRIEAGVPVFGVDIDETTIVPELGLDGLISYNKGCYIGQEIIARIHFRGHVAKRFAGLVFAEGPSRDMGGASVGGNHDLTTLDAKNAGRITSVTYSPKLDANIALGFVRYDYLAEGTELLAGDRTVNVTSRPFIS